MLLKDNLFPRGSHKFTHVSYGEKITVEFSADVGLVTLLEMFDRYVRACGYCPKGELQFIEDEPIVEVDDGLES